MDSNSFTTYIALSTRFHFCQISCSVSKTVVSFSFFKEERGFDFDLPNTGVDSCRKKSLLLLGDDCLWCESWLALRNPEEFITISFKNLLYREDSLDKLLKAIKVPNLYLWGTWDKEKWKLLNKCVTRLIK